jgi:hypothetical protein
VRLRTVDHAPAVPAEFLPRTRHQCCRAASDDTVIWETLSVWSTTRGAENELESSIWIWYDAAALTSPQSRVTGNVTVAPLAGLTSVGAAGVARLAVTPSVALRVTPNVPEIVADVEDDTACVPTVKVALVFPAPTVTLAVTVATAVVLLLRLTTAPPDGAAPVNVTVPCDVFPPVTLVGLSDSADSVGCAVPGVTVKTAPQLVFNTAKILIAFVALTLVVVMLNVVLLPPAGTVTVDGTTAAASQLEIATEAPPAGAGPLRVTVPVDDAPAVTVDGLSVSDVTPTVTPGFTVTPTLAVDAPNAAVMVAGVGLVTGNAPKENSPDVVPAETITFVGRLMAGLLADSVTSTCPAGAGAVRLTKPTPPWPPVNVFTLTVSDDNDTEEPLIVRVAESVASSYEATMLTGVVSGTFCTFMLNVMLDAPTGTWSIGKTPTAGLLVVSFTIAPLVDGAGVAGIGPLKVTVPVTLVPPVAVLALSVRLVILTPGVFRLRLAAGAPTASIDALSAIGTGDVAIEKVPEVAPAGMVMLAGTDTNSGY